MLGSRIRGFLNFRVHESRVGGLGIMSLVGAWGLGFIGLRFRVLGDQFVG